MGWFFGFKLHVIINHVGEIIDVAFTSGNIHDSNVTINLSKNLFGYLFLDKCYTSKNKAGQFDVFQRDKIGRKC